MNCIRVQRLIPALPMIVILGGLALASGLIPPQPAARAAQTTQPRAGLVVRFGDGSTRTACVALDEDGEANGEELLRASGLSTVTVFSTSNGALVCKIEQEGCPKEDCLCQCKNLGQDCRYWAYYRLGTAGWEYSNVGASGARVRDGAVEGWSWGPGGVDNGVEPPLITFSEICALPATATPTATTVPSATAMAQPNPTVEPTATTAPAPVPPQPIILPVASSTPPLTPSSAPTPSSSPTATATVPTPSLTNTPLPALAPTATPASAPTEPATLTPIPAPTDAPAPTAAPATVVVTTNMPEPRAAGGAVPSTTGPLWLPLVSRSEPTATPGLRSEAAEAPARNAPTTPPAGAPAMPPAEAPATPSAGAPPGWGAAGGGLVWFLALSGGLAVALVAVRMRRGG